MGCLSECGSAGAIAIVCFTCICQNCVAQNGTDGFVGFGDCLCRHGAPLQPRPSPRLPGGRNQKAEDSGVGTGSGVGDMAVRVV
jgi:hypothetical protein